MAKQQSNPSPWKPEYGDGCSGVPDWLPFVGSMKKCCDDHDEAFYYGGGEAEFIDAQEKFEDCIARPWCLLCKAVGWWRRKAVRLFGRKNFNWLGPRRLPPIERKKYVRRLPPRRHR